MQDWLRFVFGMLYLIVWTGAAVWVVIRVSSALGSKPERRLVRLGGALAVIAAMVISFAESGLTGFYPRVFLIADPILFGMFTIAGMGVGFVGGVSLSLAARAVNRLTSN